MEDCLFCKISQGEIPATIVYQDDDLLAFDDINPKAPVHQLIIPRKHIATLNEVESEDGLLVSKMFMAARDLALKAGVDQTGYRLVFNCNKHGGQEVYHIHLHLIGGKQLSWP